MGIADTGFQVRGGAGLQAVAQVNFTRPRAFR